MQSAFRAAVCAAIVMLAACGRDSETPPSPPGTAVLPTMQIPPDVKQIEPPPAAPTEPTAPEEPHYRLDASLKLSEIQLKGSHNSYHIRPGNDEPAWQYDLPPLKDQMEYNGVRAFELDLHYYGGQFLVFHLPDWDQRSTCYTLQDCLKEIREWSLAHPGHMPMFIFYELKDESDPEKIADHIEELEQVLVDNWPREKIFTPDDLDGSYPDPQSALKAKGGWPKLGQLRGKVIMVMHEFGLARHRYTWGTNGLWGRRMFVEHVDDSYRLAGILALDDAGYLESTIKHYVAKGFLVRTRADDLPTFGGGSWDKLNAALRSGAQIILTDYPQPWYLPDYDSTIHGGTPARCNPVTAPAGCTSLDVEDPALLQKIP